MYYVTRWSVLDDLRKDPTLSFTELKNRYPLADDVEILEGIKEYKEVCEYE